MRAVRGGGELPTPRRGDIVLWVDEVAVCDGHVCVGSCEWCVCVNQPWRANCFGVENPVARPRSMHHTGTYKTNTDA